MLRKVLMASFATSQLQNSPPFCWVFLFSEEYKYILCAFGGGEEGRERLDFLREN